MYKIFFFSTLLILTSIFGNAKENKVLIIGIDGVRPDALIIAATPNMDELILNATYSMDAINEGTTSSGPSWSAMLTGVWQEKHGVVDNSFKGKNYNEYPHFFKRVEDLNSDLHTVSICQWDPINDEIAASFADKVINVSSAEVLVSETVNYLATNNADAMFIHFDDVDGAGHGTGYSPNNPKYIKAIEKVDEGIGEVMTGLKARTTYTDENWLVIVSTDHGGLGNGHGGNSIEERNIFIICSGDEVPNEEVKKDSLLTTVLPAQNCLEDSVELYFNGSAKVATTLNDKFNFGIDKDFTIECRVRTKNSGDVAIVTDKDWHTGLNKGFVFSFQGGGNGPWKVNIGDGSNRKDISGNIVHDEEWHTLSATFDRDGLLKIFEDGSIVDSISISSIGDIYTGFPISFGADVNNNYAYKGHIAEIRIFNEVVSPKTINDWSCKIIDDTHNNFNSLIAYWRLTEGNGSATVNDYSTTVAHGEISKAVWKNAKETTKIWEYDFSNTPRQVDVAVSAMTHLCIPINEEWKLDGKNFGASCSVETSNSTIEQEGKIKVYPNPGTDQIFFEFGQNFRDNSILSVYNILGVLIKEIPIYERRVSFKRNNLAKGIYIYRVENTGTEIYQGKFTFN